MLLRCHAFAHASFGEGWWRCDRRDANVATYRFARRVPRSPSSGTSRHWLSCRVSPRAMGRHCLGQRRRASWRNARRAEVAANANASASGALLGVVRRPRQPTAQPGGQPDADLRYVFGTQRWRRRLPYRWASLNHARTSANRQRTTFQLL